MIWQGLQQKEKPKISDAVAEEVSGGGYVKEVGFKAVFEQGVRMGYTEINWPIIMLKKIFLQKKSKEKQKQDCK